jgi:hypothetical protein
MRVGHRTHWSMHPFGTPYVALLTVFGLIETPRCAYYQFEHLTDASDE